MKCCFWAWPDSFNFTVRAAQTEVWQRAKSRFFSNCPKAERLVQAGDERLFDTWQVINPVNQHRYEIIRG